MFPCKLSDQYHSNINISNSNENQYLKKKKTNNKPVKLSHHRELRYWQRKIIYS